MGFAKAAALLQEDSGADDGDDKRETGRGELEPYVDELHAGLLDAHDDAASVPSQARLDALVARSWSLVGRGGPANVVQRLGRTSQLLYLWVESMVRVPISPADREELTEGFQELVFTRVFEKRARMLTRSETEELRRYWASRQPSSALPPAPPARAEQLAEGRGRARRAAKSSRRGT